MQNKLIKIFQRAKYSPGRHLADNIWFAITQRDKRMNQIKLWIFTLAGIASLLGFVPAFIRLSEDLAQSGFYEYFSLIFSDSRSILLNWKEFIYSVTESLPASGLILTLSLVFTCLLSLRYLMKQIDKSQFLYTSTKILSI
ncbi:MAG TPA: hypothetical protein VK675_02470 [Candidatus Paceibacterota bacterium]|nr:hypothetical protein [Candidatus Paceibacterota bacterium]